MPNSLNLSIEYLEADYANGSRKPREVVDDILAQAANYLDDNIWITLLSRDQIEDYLTDLDSKSAADLPLYGIPFAIKDNIDLAGVPTTAACPDYAFTPKRSAFVVEQLIAAGAIPIGKTNMDQFATGLVGTRSPHGATRNAFNPDYISGGSSSGSAVAVAKGLASFALGTDTAGSGRVPAAFNNLVGFKPSCGLLSTRGVVPACRTLDCVSIFALNAADAQNVLRVAAVFDEEDAYARDIAHTPAPAPTGDIFRFGVPATAHREFFGDAQAKSCFEEAIQHFESLGGEAIELDFSPFLDTAKLLYEGPWVAERYAAIETFIQSSPEALLDVTRKIIEPAGSLSAVSIFQAQYKLKALKRIANKALQGLDFVLTPTVGRIFTQAEVAAEPIQRNSDLGFYTNFMNLLDFAAVAAPAGFLANGLPHGVTLFAPALHDPRLLDFAKRLGDVLALPLGATGNAYAPGEREQNADQDRWMKLAVCGAHLSGLPLNYQLLERGGYLLQSTASAACYRFYALAGGPPFKPGMIRDEENGAAIEVEVWALPESQIGSFLALIPPPLGLGNIELTDGTWIKGFICESYTLGSAREITHLGNWRTYLAQ